MAGSVLPVAAALTKRNNDHYCVYVRIVPTLLGGDSATQRRRTIRSVVDVQVGGQFQQSSSDGGFVASVPYPCNPISRSGDIKRRILHSDDLSQSAKPSFIRTTNRRSHHVYTYFAAAAAAAALCQVFNPVTVVEADCGSDLEVL